MYKHTNIETRIKALEIKLVELDGIIKKLTPEKTTKTSLKRDEMEHYVVILRSPNYDDSLSADVIEYEEYNHYYDIHGIYREEKTAIDAYKKAIKGNNKLYIELLKIINEPYLSIIIKSDFIINGKTQ